MLLSLWDGLHIPFHKALGLLLQWHLDHVHFLPKSVSPLATILSRKGCGVYLQHFNGQVSLVTKLCVLSDSYESNEF